MKSYTRYKEHTLSFHNPETEDEYCLTVEQAIVTTPGKWTLSNGDPGYPDESESYFDYNASDKPDWVTEDMITEAINNL